VLNRQTLWLMLAASGLLWCGAGAARAGDKNAELAKKAVDAFAKGVVARDVKAVMKTVDVPWCDNLNLDSTKLIAKTDELQKRLDKLINGAQQIPAKVVLDFKTVLTYDKVLEKFGKGLPEEERKILDQVLKKTDYVLGVEIKSPEGEVLAQLTFLVGMRGSEAKVVGLRQ
jgi:hypothetical protein